MIVAFFLCDVKDNKIASITTNVYSAIVAGLVHSARFTVTANIVLWFIPFAFFLYHLYKGKVRHFTLSTLMKVGLLLTISVSSFVLGNYTGWNDPIRHPNAPDGDFYWMFHSLWHFFSQIAIAVLILSSEQSRDQNTQTCIKYE